MNKVDYDQMYQNKVLEYTEKLNRGERSPQKPYYIKPEMRGDSRPESQEVREKLCQMADLYREGVAEHNYEKQKTATTFVEKHFSKWIYYLIQKYYSGYYPKYIETMYNSGVIGMIKALSRYQGGKAAFTLFSMGYIKKELTEQANYIMHNPSPHYGSMQKAVRKAMQKFYAKGITEPTVQMIADVTGYSIDQVRDTLDFEVRTDFVYIDDEDNSSGLGASDMYDDPERCYIENERYEVLHQAIDALPYEEKVALSMKFGLDEEGECSFLDISRELGIPVSKVKHLIENAIQDLLHHPLFQKEFKEQIKDTSYILDQVSVTSYSEDEITDYICDMLDSIHMNLTEVS